MSEKIGRYTEDEILEHLTEGEGRGFLGRSMYDAIFDKIHALITENNQLKEELKNASNNYTKYIQERDKVIEEVSEYLKRFDIERLHETYEHNLVDVIEHLLQILDKGESNE